MCKKLRTFDNSLRLKQSRVLSFPHIADQESKENNFELQLNPPLLDRGFVLVFYCNVISLLK